MIVCRGRNGWFDLFDVWTHVAKDGKASIGMCSKRGFRNVPPIYLEGPKEEVLEMLDKLRKELA